MCSGQPALQGYEMAQTLKSGHIGEEWPDQMFQKLREAEVRHAAYVPDAGHARLIELCRADSAMKATVLTTEEEGIGLLAGAWLGGERGVLLMQSSGLRNCRNTLEPARAVRSPPATV